MSDVAVHSNVIVSLQVCMYTNNQTGFGWMELWRFMLFSLECSCMENKLVSLGQHEAHMAHANIIHT